MFPVSVCFLPPGKEQEGGGKAGEMLQRRMVKTLLQSGLNIFELHEFSSCHANRVQTGIQFLHYLFKCLLTHLLLFGRLCEQYFPIRIVQCN